MRFKQVVTMGLIFIFLYWIERLILRFMRPILEILFLLNMSMEELLVLTGMALFTNPFVAVVGDIAHFRRIQIRELGQIQT